jgi:heme/copper-type cytochrome/quinol oxidase subunit 1
MLPEGGEVDGSQKSIGAGATTLEWTLSSPPPFHQFDRLR